MSANLMNRLNHVSVSNLVPLRAVGWRHGLQVIAASTSGLFFLGMFYRSASLYHPQRRAILHLKDMSKKKGKDKNKIENKPPYFDFATLRLRSLQVSSTLGKKIKDKPPTGDLTQHGPLFLWRLLAHPIFCK